MKCYEKMAFSRSATIIECCQLLKCAASVAAAKGSKRVALVSPGGFAVFYKVVVRRIKVCLKKIGIGDERAVGKGDVVATKERVCGEYWHELQQRGVVALVMPPPSGCRKEAPRGGS